MLVCEMFLEFFKVVFEVYLMIFVCNFEGGGIFIGIFVKWIVMVGRSFGVWNCM